MTSIDRFRDRLIPWEHTTSARFTVRGYHTPPSGKPVIHFVHGNGFCCLTYEHLLARLSERYDLFLSDVQGHGHSDHGGRFQGWNKTAAHCAAAWAAHRHLWPESAHFGVGHSFGGVVTALMMAKDPALFERAVLLDPVLFTPKMMGVMALSDVVGLWRFNSMASRARKRRSHWDTLDEAFSYCHGRGMFRGWQDESLWSYVEHGLKADPKGGWRLKCRPSREAELFGSFPKRLWYALDRVRTPTHVIYGASSYPFVGESANRWVQQNPCVSRQEVKGGHCFMMENPKVAADLVDQALAADEMVSEAANA
ncbi:alpha/beta hydrolase [Marinobacteraceae bacterium S3BR75-40.1]